METDYLNFHDGGQFSEFSSNFDEYDFSDDAQKLRMVIDDDFDYSHSRRAHENFWEIEQELNGDMAVLPASGVSSQMPKIENMNQDFVNTFNDWSEHLGALQEYESNNELITLHNNLPESLNISFPEIFSDDNNDMYIPPTENTPEDIKITPSPIKTLPELPSLYLTSPVKSKESPLLNKVKLEPEENELTEVKENFDEWADKEEGEGCIDVETVSEYQPVLEARDVKSLLEQFEASEANLDLINPNSTKKNTESKPSCEINNKVANKPKDVSKSLESTEPQVSERHKNIRDSLPKEVIDRINASARKKVISVIPALSTNIKNNSRNNNRTTKATSTRSKGSKVVNQNTAFDTVVQNDHTYCTSSSNNNNSNYASNNSTGHASKPGKGKQGKKSINSKVNKPVQNHRNNLIKRMDSWTDSSSKKDSGLESGDVSDASEELATKSSVNLNDQQNQSINKRSLANNSVPVNKIINVDNKKNQAKPVSGIKIQSALATSILQMRNGVLTKTKSVDENILKGKMVSVLKKPPVNKLIGFNESIITTKNSLNDDVQNIIVQDTSMISSSSSSSSINENEKKPPKRKLNLAEYRSRRDQNSAGNSRTCSPIQPMTLIYIHHASTTTDPITTDSDNPVWSEREIVSMLKPKNLVDEPRIKPAMCDASVQTHETVFDNPNSSDVIVEKPEIEASLTTDVKVVNDEKISLVEKDQAFGKKRNYRQRRASSSSRSRSRSRSRSSNSIQSRSKKERKAVSRKRVSRSRSHNKYKTNKRRSSSSRSRSQSRSRSRSRSLSRSRSRSWSLSSRRNIRRRKISHRRSSVSSNSSWSSRSRSRSTYRSRSFSRSSRSRSRSRSSRSRSRSRSRYSSSTRSPSYTRNSYNNTWHNHEKTRQVEERRVIYVGRIDEGITKADLRKRFEAFGPVTDISLHFREHGDNYGFVTFANKHDAYNAVEHGNDDPALPRYDLSFGGRRAFCKVKYADLDGAPNSSYSTGRSVLNSNNEDNSFDFLLKEVQAKLRNRKV
ncbi:uncharacterized protein DDB_G0287625 isoform X2 [Cotesia glomerata]|uniref:uncharacterized protein DDB_G0287625 isoform X2 n=1 Tax=Cotesia glomerata TaxID=32391 RepID=UPI001D001FA9|nr:uncharacterized protein DDB_G0287625 isoform X2 [Cotesia glomerata]